METANMKLWVCIAAILLILGEARPSEEKQQQQQKKDKITDLPGQPSNVKFDQYSGYITVNERVGRAFFYWFIEAEDDPPSKPLLLWLNGGPGASSIAFGEAEEIGPFRVNTNGKTLYYNKHSWNKLANLLFIDSPAGIGFSYSNGSDIYNIGDKKTARDNYAFLVGWFKRFPQYKHREFYIAGESYGGHYVPQLAHVIYKQNTGLKNPEINLKGYIVGNAVTDDFYDMHGVFEYYWTHGLVSDYTYRMLNTNCYSSSFKNESDACYETFRNATKEMGNIDQYSIYTPTCPNTRNTHAIRRRPKVWRRPKHWRDLLGYDPCTQKYSEVYFNIPEVQKALHANVSGFIPRKWEPVNYDVNKSWGDSPRTVLPIYRELINAGLRIWVFSGDTDSKIPITSTRHSINALRLPTVSSWHAWYEEEEVGGWTQEYKGLTFVAVRGAGHKVPLIQPTRAFTLIKSFLNGSSMPVTH